MGRRTTQVPFILFSLCEALKHKNHQDGPTKTLLSYMKRHDYVAPSDWKHYRPLTSKWVYIVIFIVTFITIFLSQSLSVFSRLLFILSRVFYILSRVFSLNNFGFLGSLNCDLSLWHLNLLLYNQNCFFNDRFFFFCLCDFLNDLFHVFGDGSFCTDNYGLTCLSPRLLNCRLYFLFLSFDKIFLLGCIYIIFVITYNCNLCLDYLDNFCNSLFFFGYWVFSRSV